MSKTTKYYLMICVLQTVLQSGVFAGESCKSYYEKLKTCTNEICSLNSELGESLKGEFWKDSSVAEKAKTASNDIGPCKAAAENLYNCVKTKLGKL